jgi:hypothetical protein
MTTIARKPGPAMNRVVFYVDRHPGCRMLPAAEAAGANGSRRYGYAAVDRAIRAGIIRASAVIGSRGQYVGKCLWPLHDTSDNVGPILPENWVADGEGPIRPLCGHEDCMIHGALATACAASRTGSTT